jgi:hypothetical protein
MHNITENGETVQLRIDLDEKQYFVEIDALVESASVSLNCRFTDGETMLIEGQRTPENIIWEEKDEHTHSHLTRIIGDALEKQLRMDGKLR